MFGNQRKDIKTETRIVFMGTPDFAVASLKALVGAGEKVVGVITAPDRPAGRGQQLRSSPVKTFALKHKIPVLQALKLKDPSFFASLKSLNADLFVVVAFRMLPESIWKIPPMGTFNLHASLLPQYRGAAPINWAIMNGEKETGLSTFFIDEKIDTGRIILQEKVPISDTMTAGELHDILMIKGADLVVKTLKQIRTGNTEPIRQTKLYAEGTELMPAPKLFKEHCRVNWKLESREIHNFIRGLSPYPGAWTIFLNEDDQKVSAKILRAEIIEPSEILKPGTVSKKKDEGLIVYSGNGAIRILNLQPAGKRPMTTEEFLRGYRKDLIKAL